ncbi:hypothetical protein [Proteus terrae]
MNVLSSEGSGQSGNPPYKLECPRLVQAVRLVHTAPKTHSITLGMV